MHAQYTTSIINQIGAGNRTHNKVLYVTKRTVCK